MSDHTKNIQTWFAMVVERFTHLNKVWCHHTPSLHQVEQGTGGMPHTLQDDITQPEQQQRCLCPPSGGEGLAGGRGGYKAVIGMVLTPMGAEATPL